jgi:hypothetical protein
MTELRFPADHAVGEVWWEDDPEAGHWDHRPATGVVEVPDGTPVLFDGGRRYSVEPVDLAFLRDLPPDSVFEANLTGEIVPASFPAVAHLAPGLRDLSVYLDDLGPEAPAVLAELTALETLSLAGHADPEDGPSPRLNDQALSTIADLPALQVLMLLGGSYTERGLQQLARLPRLRELYLQRDGLTPAMFGFAARLPALAEITGLDEDPDTAWTPEQVEELRAMLPHVRVCQPDLDPEE